MTGMKFPVDLLADVSQAELERLAHSYMKNLLYSNPDFPEHLTLSDSTQVTIDISSVGFVPLYGSSDKQKILALFSPSDPFTAVALYLLDQWWAVDDILKTAVPARDGAVEVETVAERIVLYVLNRVIYRAKEMSSEEVPFLCHGEKDYAKILWNNGEAVGFYSVKPSGSLCNSFSTRSYQLPVMDTIYVKKCQRGKGFGFHMLEDFVLSFKEDCLGLRYPLTKSMYKVCQKYLCQYPGDTDLLWEVESIGGPNQRTNIASKIQAMDLSAISKSLSFTEESLVITEVTEKDMVMETVTTQIKEAESMEYTVEIVEEVAVLRATKVSDAEVPVTAQGRSSGSKRSKMGEKITEDKSEKVIREKSNTAAAAKERELAWEKIAAQVSAIEDIEAETPRKEQVSAQLNTELHNVSELVQTEALFNVAPEEKGEDVVDTTPEREAATNKSVTVLASQVLEEADVTSAPMTEEPQVEDDATQDLNNPSHDSQITVENVTPEIEEAEEACQKEDTAMLVVSKDVLESYKEAETLDKVGEATQIEITDEKSEERVTQHEISLSRHATSEDGEAGKAIKTVQSETPRRRSQQHSKPEGIKEETIVQDGGRVLRGRTVLSSHIPKHKYTQHSQKVCEELEEEVNEVAEGNEVSTTDAVEELTVTEGEEPEKITSIKEDVVAVEESREEEKQQLEDEHLIKEAETEKQEEPGVEDTVVKGSPSELPDTGDTALTKENEDEKVTDESENEQKGEEAETSVILDKQEVSGEIEEPPVVQKRALRGRHKVTSKPKSRKQSEGHQKQEEEHTDEADLGEGGSTGEEKADEQVTDKQKEEHHQVEQEEAVDKTEAISPEELAVVEEGTISKAEDAAEDIIPLTEVNGEESKEVQEEEETEGETDTVSVMEADKEEQADDMIQAPDTVASASEKVIPYVVLDETVAPVAVEPQEKVFGSEIPKFQKATVILVDLKTTCRRLRVKELEETPADGECAAPEKEKLELIAAEGKVSSCVTEEQTPEPERLVLEEEIVGKQENITEASVGKIITEKEVEETGTVEMEGGMEGKAKDAITVRIPVDEKQSTIWEMCADTEADIPVVDDTEDNLPLAEVDEATSMDEEEAPVVATRALRSGTKTVTATPRHKTERSRKPADEQEAENGEEDDPAMITLTRGRISASATTKEKSRRTHKQIQEEEQKREDKCKSVGETGIEEEEAVKAAAVEKTDKEIEKCIEMETGDVKEEATSEKEESLESKIDLEEEKAVAEEEQRETEASGEECDERKPVMEDEEKELPSVAVTRSLRSGGETSKAPPKNRSRRSKKQQDEEEEGGASVGKSADEDEPPAEPIILRRVRKSNCRNCKQLQKEEDEPKESAEEAQVEEEEAGLGSAEKAKSVDEEEEEPIVTKTRTLRSRKKAVKVTPRCKLARSSQKRGEEEIGQEERAVQVRVLRRGRKSIPVTRRCTTKRTHKQFQEEEEGGESAVGEGKSEEEEKQAEKRQHTIDQKKGKKLKREEKHATPQVENIEPEMGVEKVDTVAGEAVTEHDAPEEGQANSTETVADEDAATPVGQSADEGKTLDDVAEEAVTTQDRVALEQSTSTSEAAGESAQETLLTAKDNEAKGISEEEEAPVIETRVLRSGEKTVRATTRSKTTKRQGDEQEEEAAGEKSTEDEPAVETRVLRKGKSAAATPRHKSERARTQGQKEEGREKETTQAEKIQVEEPKGNEKEDKSDEKTEEKDSEKAAAQKEKNTEPEIEMEKIEAVDEESLTEQETLEEEWFAVSETCADGQEENLVRESAEETCNTDEEESPVGETRVLRSGGKAVKDTSRSKTTKSQQEENEQEGTVLGQGAETDEPAAETRVLRKGRRSAPTTPRRKSKRARTQCLVTSAEETEGEDEEAGQESLEDKEEKPEQEGKSIEIGLKKDDVEEVEVESAAGEESAVGDAEQMKDASAEDAAMLEKEDNSVTTVDETSTNMVEISSAEVEETNSAEDEETTVMEKSTAATEVESDSAAAEEEALIEDASVVAEEEAPAVITTLRRQKEENPEDDERQEEVHQLRIDSPENSKINAEEQAKTEEASPTGQEAGPPAEDIAEDQAKETAGEEPATEEMQSPEEELSESKEHKTVDALADGRRKSVADKGDKAEEIQFPKPRSIRKRQKVDYRENDEDDEEDETEGVTDKEEENKVESDEDKDNEKAECSANELIEQLEESSKENLENNMGAIESTSEKDNVLDLVLDTEEEVEGAGISPEDEEYELNMSEEEVEPVVIGKRVLRGRSVPSVIITPRSKSKRHTAKFKIAEESLSDEEKRPKSAQKRGLRKRKSIEVIPTRKSKRHSRV